MECQEVREQVHLDLAGLTCLHRLKDVLPIKLSRLLQLQALDSSVRSLLTVP